MNSSKMIIATALVALVGAGSAFAQEGTQDFPATQSFSSKSRAEVKSELVTAQRAGGVSLGEASATPAPVSTLTRNQVVAELREAQRLGLLNYNNEGNLRVATAAENESIRQAGLRAVNTALARNSR